MYDKRILKEKTCNVALPEYISILSQPRLAGDAIKSAWNSMIHLHPGDALSDLAKLAGDVLTGVAAGLGGYLIYDILKNNNLKTSQKIIPVIGYSIAIALAIPASIAVIVGASFLVPPFMFVASIGATIRNTMVYWSERKERNSLRKELQTTADIERLIRGLKLNPIDKEKVNTYTFSQQKIYQSLYQLRSMLIKTTSISLQDRQLLVAQLNKAIEDFSKDNNQGGQTVENIDAKKFTITLDIDLLDKLPAVKEVIKQSKEELEKNIQSYNSACVAVRQIPQVSPSVWRSINQYKLTREKVVSQDLPEYIKNEIISSLEKKKVSKDDIKLLYSQLGNHYLNITADKQLKAQDVSFEQYYLSSFKETKAVHTINQYIQSPRELISHLQALSRNLSSEMVPYNEAKETLEKYIRELIQSPDTLSMNEWFSIEDKLSSLMISNANSFDIIRDKINQCQQVNSDYQTLSIDDKLNSRIYSQKQLTLSQHANLGMQFDSPHIDFDLKKNNLIKRATDYVAAKRDRVLRKNEDTKSQVDEVVEMIQQQTLAPDYKVADNKQVKSNSEHLKKDFTQRFANTFNVIEKKEKLRFLEHAVPKRLINVGLCLGLSVISLATTVLIPAVASPAAPAAAAAITGLSVVSALFTTAALSISFKITVDLFKSEKKVNKPKETVKGGIAPDISYDKDQHLKQQKALNKKLANNEKASRKAVVKTNPLNEGNSQTSSLFETGANKQAPASGDDKEKLPIKPKKNSPRNP